MARAEPSIDGATRWMRYSARAWTLVWASIWTITPIIALFDPQAGVIPTRKWVLVSPLELALMLFFLGGSAVPWLRERVGGAVLVLQAALALPWARSSTSLWAPLLRFTVLPHVLAGALFLACSWKTEVRPGPWNLETLTRAFGRLAVASLVLLVMGVLWHPRPGARPLLDMVAYAALSVSSGAVPLFGTLWLGCWALGKLRERSGPGD